ncbi:MAG: EamA family transporter [Deltaproteobacteria bacterium]|nr:EamA family transporter [Deltaproteobacteria bacterium]MBW1952030.1 EamA family transporter [Deltaproteobacteria bacterium]MBW1986094.1 EamA family transporter [Deltaproteobacteria bacterium]MBW2134220.1 EamA family transporter [Deltaproteobacteria bacterium]
MIRLYVLLLILVDVIFNVSGQLLLKHGMTRIGNFDLSLANLYPVFFKAATSRYVIMGLFCYGIGFMIWLIVLAKAEVSYAYPLISLGYVFTALLAWSLFGEAVTLARMAGIVITCVGVFLIATS